MIRRPPSATRPAKLFPSTPLFRSSVADVKEILGLYVIGVIPEAPDVLSASNAGTPVILNEESDVSQAYEDAVARLMGDTLPLRFLDEPKKDRKSTRLNSSH